MDDGTITEAVQAALEKGVDTNCPVCSAPLVTRHQGSDDDGDLRFVERYQCGAMYLWGCLPIMVDPVILCCPRTKMEGVSDG